MAIAIVAVVVGLLVVGLSAGREAARRAQCLGNLKQIGLAILSYQSVHSTLPLAYGGGGNGLSYLGQILPFMDQEALYDQINMSTGPSSTVRHTSLRTFLCPSDGLVRTNPRGATNYAGNQGSGVQEYGYNGVFSLGKPVGASDLSDGASQTAAVSEWLTGYDTGHVRDPRRSVFMTAESFAGKGQLDLFTAECTNLDPKSAPLAPVTIGIPWTHGDSGHSLYNHVVSVNQNTCLNGSLHQQGAWTAKSNHPGGVNVLFAEGHARFVKSTIPLTIWRALGSRNGGEVVAPGDF